MNREDLERAVIEAAKAWHAAEDRDGMKMIFDPTLTNLAAAVEALINAPVSTAYEDRDGDVWYESRETDVAASLLAEGDEIFSAATGAWHAVKEASSHQGRTTIVIDRNDGTSFRFQPAPETTFRTRRGAAGRKADLWGAEEVIHSA